MAEEDDKRAAAIQRLKAKREFRSHAVVYVIVNAMLVIVWYATGAQYFWPIWAMVGWGIGLAMHAWSVFFDRPITEDEIRREMERSR